MISTRKKKDDASQTLLRYSVISIYSFNLSHVRMATDLLFLTIILIQMKTKNRETDAFHRHVLFYLHLLRVGLRSQIFDGINFIMVHQTLAGTGVTTRTQLWYLEKTHAPKSQKV